MRPPPGRVLVRFFGCILACLSPAGPNAPAAEIFPMQHARPIVRHRDSITPQTVPCGESRRLITRADTPNLGLHVTHIKAGELHYHRHTEEIYYIVSGEGVLELDGEQVALTPGTAVHIPPGVRHRGWGDFESLIITSPAFDPEDEVLV